MNRLVLTFISLIIYTGVALAGNAPAAAEAALSEKFTKAEDITWEKESPNNFRAEFTLSGVKMWANFNQDGKWLQTKTAAKTSDLPNSVGDFVKKNFGTGVVQKVAKVERSTIDVVLYELEIKTGSKTSVELVTADGRKITE
ncbi:MAG TPA: PepSY-like domain-containing protein [Chitinophagales bacterium]|nr:PepSY-like domain-containing protein [Chitinophagales bacterium]